ncbi:MAG: polymer-forming cytoskeletal protein, partial [Firmicutes bacterium]|nr:polymer-forming cytoskeletal protein [Bacillota bacterium]
KVPEGKNMQDAKKRTHSSKAVDTIIGKNTDLSGTIKTTGAVRIDGNFEGNINTTSDVVIGEDGSVAADIQAVNITIAGKVEGNVEVKGRLELVPTGSLIGNAKVGVLVIDEGARLEGQIEMVVKEGQKIVKQQVEPKKEIASK